MDGVRAGRDVRMGAGREGGGRGRAWTYSAAVLPEGSEFGPEAHSTDGTVGIRGEC